MTTATLADTGRERCFRSSARAASRPRTGPASPVSAALRAENSFSSYTLTVTKEIISIYKIRIKL